MDITFAQWIVGQSGLAGIAALALYLLNRTHSEAMRREIENAEQNRADKQELMHIIAENAKALAALEQAIRSMK